MMRLFVLTSVLFGVTWASDPDAAACGSRDPDTWLLLCHCDALCEIYRDCCFGYAKNSSESPPTDDIQVKLMEMLTCERFPGLDFNISVVSKLDTNLARYLPILRVCQTPNSLDVMQAIPMYDERLKINFKSVACHTLFLFLNDLRIPLDNVSQTWALQIPAECFYRVVADLPDRDFSVFEAMVLSGKYCRFTTVPPEGYNTRICFQPRDSDLCVQGKACTSYQSPVMNEVGEVFKNRECAACARRGPTTQSIGRGEPKGDADEITLFTLRRRPISQFAIDKRFCWIKNSTQCTQDEMVYCIICLKPIESVQGFLFGAELVVKSDKTLNIDATNSQAINRIIIPLTEAMIEMNMKVLIDRVRNTGTCIHTIRISLYLKDAVGYDEYHRLLSSVNKTFEAKREGLESEIGKLFLNGTADCGVGGDAGSVYGVFNVSPNLDSIDQRLVIFGAVFGFIVLSVVFVIVIKMFIMRLSNRQNPASADTGTAEDGGN